MHSGSQRLYWICRCRPSTWPSASALVIARAGGTLRPQVIAVILGCFKYHDPRQLPLTDGRSRAVFRALLSQDSQFTQPRQSLSWPEIPMTPRDPLQQLYNLDRTSPQFRNQLRNFLRGDEYQDVVPSLQSEDLTQLVEYLDSVSLQNISPRPALNAGIGPLRYFRPRECPISGIPARTQKYMRS